MSVFDDPPLAHGPKLRPVKRMVMTGPEGPELTAGLLEAVRTDRGDVLPHQRAEVALRVGPPPGSTRACQRAKPSGCIRCQIAVSDKWEGAAAVERAIVELELGARPEGSGPVQWPC